MSAHSLSQMLASALVEGERSTVERLHDVSLLVEGLSAAQDTLVYQARANGATWAEIGEAVGMTRQGAQRRWGVRHPAPEPTSGRPADAGPSVPAAPLP